MSAEPKIVVVGAHAGDCEIMAGALVAQHVATGGAAVLVHMTLGERGHPSLSSGEYARQKRDEAVDAAGRLGAELRILPFRDGELIAGPDAKTMVAEIIRAEKPDVVITHWSGSFHRDHAACHDIVNDAVFYAGLADMSPGRDSHQITALYYAENWEDPRGFDPALFVNTSSAHDTWIEAVKAYELFRGGLSSFPYLRHYEALSTLRGTQSGFERAAALSVPPEARRVCTSGLRDAIPFPVTTAASIVSHPDGRRTRP